MTRPVDDDYFFIGPRIVARLALHVPELPAEVVERPEQLLEADKRSAVLAVMWAGDRFNVGPNGRVLDGAMVYQRWLVILGSNNVGKAAAARAAAAGPLMSRVHRALAGWRPEDCVYPMLRTNGVAPTFTEHKAVLPLGFEIQLAL